MSNFLTALLEYHDTHAEAFELTLRCILDVKHHQREIILEDSLELTLGRLFNLPTDVITKVILQDLSDDKISKWWTYLNTSSP